MSAYGVLPDVPDCQLCDGTGWTTIVNSDGDACSILCPECDTVPGADVDVDEHLDVPF